MKKVVYIAHPFFNSPAENTERVKKYIERAVREGNTPLCSITMFGFLQGKISEKEALNICLCLIDLADEVWLCGNWQKSKGCKKEFEYARLKQKRIVFLP